ncbi:dynein heavy chain 12, axonemal-like [Elysia marginata]|uniref:Dynein heavy chain 12, axonemal-like n=1 Tax=Elysia marginata TaxID=1093978 RepID=A0AAV4HWT9_9GAST|nr:dynein heavy chain 12, axonemal-like [Elysia marginata]
MATQNGGLSRGSPRATDNLTPLQNGKAQTSTPATAGITRPPGLPVLPPIRKPDNPKVDPYANSKLMTFRLAKHQKNLLLKILDKQAAQVANDEKFNYRQEMDEKKPEPPPPEMPPEMNYRFLKGCVESAPVEEMQQSWADSILSMVPENLRSGPVLRDLLQELFTEVRSHFESSMRKSMVQHVLMTPQVKGLEGEKAGPPPAEQTHLWAVMCRTLFYIHLPPSYCNCISGLDYSQPWHDDYTQNQTTMLRRLFCLHPSHQTVLQMCQGTLGNMILVDVGQYRLSGPMEFESLKNNVILDLEKAEEKLMHSWHPNIINIFTDKEQFLDIAAEDMESFYCSVTTLVSNQLKDLLVRTIDSYVSLFEPENHLELPVLKMELTFDDQKMQFYPPVEDLEETVLFVVKQICKTMQQVPTVQSWLGGGNTVSYTDAKVAPHILQVYEQRLKEAVARYFEGPKAHLASFVERYDYIINGEALDEIKEYMKEEHTFAEFTVEIEKFRNLASEIMGLPSIEHFDMIRLDCEDLKRGLAQACRNLANELLSRVSSDHRQENESICKEFHNIKERALAVPETSEELIDMLTFVENARTTGMIKLNQKITESKDRLAYLIDVFMFEPRDIELNCEVLTWPKRIMPVFDDNDTLVEQSRQRGEKELLQKREKVMLELEKLRQRVDEFNDYSELDMMNQYVQDVRTVQRRIAELNDQVNDVISCFILMYYRLKY